MYPTYKLITIINELLKNNNFHILNYLKYSYLLIILIKIILHLN